MAASCNVCDALSENGSAFFMYILQSDFIIQKRTYKWGGKMEKKAQIPDEKQSGNLEWKDMQDYFTFGGIGFWKLELETGKKVRMYVDSNMRNLIGLPEGLSPEDNYSFFHAHIYTEDCYLIAEFKADMQRGEAVVEYRYHHPSEGEKHIRCSGRNIVSQGNCTVIMGYDQELSEVLHVGKNIQRENQLLRQNRKLELRQIRTDDYYRNLMDMVICGVISYTVAEHRLLHMNAEALRICGVKNISEAQKHMLEIWKSVFYPDPGLPDKLKKLCDDGGIVDYECTITAIDGQTTDVLARSEIFSSPQGELCVVTTFLDISESLILKNEKKVLDTLCADYIGVYLCDLKSDSVVPVNPTSPADEQRKEKEIGPGSRSFYMRARYAYEHLIVQESAPDFLEKINAAYLMEYLSVHPRFTYRLRMKPNLSGHENFEIQIVRLNPTENGFKIIMGFRYIDDVIREEERHRIQLEKAVKEAKRANEAKTNFLRRMSHDIRTPLNGILGLLKIDESHFDDPELVKENHKKMEVSANYLLSLINDVLQTSKLEDGKVLLTHEVIKLTELTLDIVNIIIGRATEAGIKWDYEKGKTDIPYPYIYGSPVHLRQIFLNIYGNCIKYNRPGGKITTTVDTLPERDGICTYRWIISDTGIGMSQEFLKHIFDPFAQEKMNARSTYQGIGLGMFIVKSLIDQMGGTIKITSQEGVGSTFEIVIPFDIAPAPDEIVEQTEADKDAIRGLHLMLVEDNELNAEIAQVLLMDEGAEITVVTDGQQAVDLFNSSLPGTFDAILMDIMMPVMDGLTATKTIRALEHPDAKKIPIIAMTANAFKEDERKCFEAGMNAHLAKPLDIEKVKRTIQKYVVRSV